jgi:hypothetical protein
MSRVFPNLLEGDRGGMVILPEQERRYIGDYKKSVSNPCRDLPTFTICRKIFFTSAGSLITAFTFMGE